MGGYNFGDGQLMEGSSSTLRLQQREIPFPFKAPLATAADCTIPTVLETIFVN